MLLTMCFIVVDSPSSSWTGALTCVYMTALDMFGCSVTLLKLDSELESLLKDKCDTVAMKRRG